MMERWAYLPSAVDTSWLCLVQSRLVVIWIKANDERRDTKRPNASRLSVPLQTSSASTWWQDRWKTNLLNARDMPCDILHSHWIFDSQTVTLALYPGLVNENPAIGGEA